VCALALLLPSTASAWTVVGFGDSITSTTFDQAYFIPGSYLDYLGPEYDYEDRGDPAITTIDLMFDVINYVDGGPTADAVVILTGTPDTARTDYDEATTVANIAAMIDYVQANTSLPIVLIAPPPAVQPCDNIEFVTGGAVLCDPINPAPNNMITRLEELADALDALAASRSVGFVDALQIFMDEPGGPGTLMRNVPIFDGIHPNQTGDQRIASALEPILDSYFVPEPSTDVLLMLGLVGLAVVGSPRRSA
jgi:lysophospholipase L1-like esterase